MSRNMATYSATISIHALREEGDDLRAGRRDSRPDFYPRPPRGGRLTESGRNHLKNQFLSTPSARRATKLLTGGVDVQEFLSTPSARRATEIVKAKMTLTMISIHALREEGDLDRSLDEINRLLFLSTPSARRATRHIAGEAAHHADFYPRPPRGGRHTRYCVQCQSFKFLSTPSARRATDHPQLPENHPQISIHALREEGDLNVSPGRTSST